ncbi:F-box-like domain protein [Rhizoctonia solani]|uniref:F-box-like domain protein n=1 Tax=Rhizoctonia solani TaxID=456999 RepID=A0A8H8P364_9AGAM|nr:F-box-like domain protein [Rhizoctonia solani]QRW23595.1 F-box-like domain protein [Rhizoctonia solani]
MVAGNVWILYIVPVMFESVLFLLTVARIYVLSKEFGSTPLMQTLAQNGISYFAALVGIMILACVAGVIPPLKIAANGSG